MCSFLFALAVFPLVYLVVGCLISLAGKAYFDAILYGGMIQSIGSATAWLWIVPLGMSLGWKYLKTYRENESGRTEPLFVKCRAEYSKIERASELAVKRKI